MCRRLVVRERDPFLLSLLLTHRYRSTRLLHLSHAIRSRTLLTQLRDANVGQAL